MKSPYVEWMDAVQKGVTAFLRPMGFSRKGRAYNRSREDGVVQVIGFQMGPYEIGVKPTPPPSRDLPFADDLYGKFTVNLGVFVDDIWKVENASPAKAFIQDANCHMRRRLGSSQIAGKEYWWSLDQSVELLVVDIVSLLQNDGLPFLEHFATKRDVIGKWIGYTNNGARLSARARVDVAILLAKMGDKEKATLLMAEHISLSPSRDPTKGHCSYVIALGQKLGLEDLSHYAVTTVDA